jgi:HlyD family secretion protein
LKKIFIASTITIIIIVILLFVNKIIIDNVSKVKVCIAEKTSLITSITSKGYIEAVKKEELFVEEPLRVDEVRVSEGQQVCKGDILASLDLSELNLEFKNAIANAEMEEIRLNELKKQINEGESIGIQIKKLEIANLKVEELQKKIEKQDKYLISPINGVVTQLNISKGRYVDIIDPLIIISDMSELQVRLEVDEYYISDIETGQDVIIFPKAYEDKEVKGLVRYISPYAERKNNENIDDVSIEVIVDIINFNNILKPGYTVEAKIITERKAETLIVPYEAVLQDEANRDYVYIVGTDNKAIKKYVLIGKELDLEVELLEGLDEGDVVILNPNEEISSKVKIAEYIKR